MLAILVALGITGMVAIMSLGTAIMTVACFYYGVDHLSPYYIFLSILFGIWAYASFGLLQYIVLKKK